MKKFFYLLSVAALCLAAASCEKPDNGGNNGNNGNGGNKVPTGLCGLIWVCETEDGVCCFDFKSGYDASGLNTSGGNADGDYGSYTVGLLEGSTGVVMMSGRIIYYSEQVADLVTTYAGEDIEWTWSDMTSNSATVSCLTGDLADDYPCTVYTGGPITWSEL